MLQYTDGGVLTKLTVESGVSGINSAIFDCKAAGAQIVVVLLHEGWDASLEGSARGVMNALTESIFGAAAVFGAHTHRSFQVGRYIYL